MANRRKQTPSSPETITVAIIGGGIAGMTAAVQLRRLGADPLLFEPGPLGGLLHHASRIDNYPGFPEGITGPALADRLAEQVERFKVRIEPARVERLAWSARTGVFTLAMADRSVSAQRVIVASGTRPRPYPPALQAPPKARERIFDGIVPLRTRRDSRIAVIGASDAAYDYALSLAGPNRVWLLARSGRSRAILPLLEPASAHPYLSIEHGITVRGFSVRGGTLRIAAERGGKRFNLEVDSAVTAIGRDPETGFLPTRLLALVPKLEAAGRLWMAGDVVRGRMRQASIAAGDGMRAAMELWNVIKGGTTGDHVG